MARDAFLGSLGHRGEMRCFVAYAGNHAEPGAPKRSFASAMRPEGPDAALAKHVLPTVLRSPLGDLRLGITNVIRGARGTKYHKVPLPHSATVDSSLANRIGRHSFIFGPVTSGSRPDGADKK